MNYLAIIITLLIGTLTSTQAQSGKNRDQIPRDTTYTVYQSLIKIQKDYPQAKPARAILPKGVKAEMDLVYDELIDSEGNSRKLHVDLFRPDGKGTFPAVIMVHGGGWSSGDKSMQVPMAMKLAEQGFVTIAVEYQLSLEAQYPQAVYNLKSAIRWARANASRFGIDTSRIAISGCSAGGQLDALVGMTNGLSQFVGNLGNKGYSSHVHAVLNIDGVVDFLAPASLNKERKPNSADESWLGGSFLEKPGVWKDASAIFWVNKHSPPILFLNSGFSRFHAGQDEMIGMLKELGIYHEVYTFAVKVHPFWLFHPWFEPTVEKMTSFLNLIFTK